MTAENVRIVHQNPVSKHSELFKENGEDENTLIKHNASLQLFHVMYLSDFSCKENLKFFLRCSEG